MGACVWTYIRHTSPKQFVHLILSLASCGASRLYNLIEGLFQDFLVQSMEESVEKALVTTVNQQVAEILSTLDLDVKLDDTASVDFSMTGPPTVTSSYLSVPDKGQFYAVSNSPPPPFPLWISVMHQYLHVCLYVRASLLLCVGIAPSLLQR